MPQDILFRQEHFVFSYRVAGILYHQGHILVQRPPHDDCALIGGHVAAGETAEEALIREYREELHAPIAVERLMAIGEIFFPWGKSPCHQIALYYLIRLTDQTALPMEGCFHGYDDLGGERIDLDFLWLPVKELVSSKVYPLELTPYLICPPEHPIHFISRDIPPDQYP